MNRLINNWSSLESRLMGSLMCLWARVKLYLGNSTDAIDKLSLMDTASQASETDYFANMLWAFAE
jgi:hypothetical protein